MIMNLWNKIPPSLLFFSEIPISSFVPVLVFLAVSSGCSTFLHKKISVDLCNCHEERSEHIVQVLKSSPKNVVLRNAMLLKQISHLLPLIDMLCYLKSEEPHYGSYASDLLPCIYNDMINMAISFFGQSDCLKHAKQFRNTFTVSQLPFSLDGTQGHSHETYVPQIYHADFNQIVRYVDQSIKHIRYLLNFMKYL